MAAFLNRLGQLGLGVALVGGKLHDQANFIFKNFFTDTFHFELQVLSTVHYITLTAVIGQ